jgi:hypothetical protein
MGGACEEVQQQKGNGRDDQLSQAADSRGDVLCAGHKAELLLRELFGVLCGVRALVSCRGASLAQLLLHNAAGGAVRR